MSLWPTPSWALPTLRWQETDNGDGSFTYLFEINPNTPEPQISFLDFTIEGNLNQVQLTDPTAISVIGGDPNILYESQRGIGEALDPIYQASSHLDTFVADGYFPGKVKTVLTPADGSQSMRVAMTSFTGGLGGPVPNDFFELAQVTVWGGELSIIGHLLSVADGAGTIDVTFTAGSVDDSFNFVNTDFGAIDDAVSAPGWYYHQVDSGGTTSTEPPMLVEPLPEPPVDVFEDETYSSPPLEGEDTALIEASDPHPVDLLQDPAFSEYMITLQWPLDIGDIAREEIPVLLTRNLLDLTVTTDYDDRGYLMSAFLADVSPYAATGEAAIAIDEARLLVPEPASLTSLALGIVRLMRVARRRRG